MTPTPKSGEGGEGTMRRSFYTLGVFVLAGTAIVTVLCLIVGKVDLLVGGLIIATCIGAILDG